MGVNWEKKDWKPGVEEWKAGIHFVLDEAEEFPVRDHVISRFIHGLAAGRPTQAAKNGRWNFDTKARTIPSPIVQVSTWQWHEGQVR